jgi:hypothetical protein
MGRLLYRLRARVADGEGDGRGDRLGVRGVSPIPDSDPLKAEGLPQAVLDAREVLGVERAEHALDELFLHGEVVRDPRRAWVTQTDGLPMLNEDDRLGPVSGGSAACC